ncbi:MAG: hypothetical protein J0H60_22985, partial [Rhizobiales bacterium]|nr:hypothetical protein [Hyphomicrobiales bacterium]
MPVEALVASAIALLAVVLTCVQVYIELSARKRQRDNELTSWGMRTISVMAELESQCAPFAKEVRFDSATAESLSHQASALVDQGRFFFPNVSVVGDPRGYRVDLLDEVLRAFHVARYLATYGAADGHLLRAHVWSARTRFVKYLQREMKMSL